MLPRDRLARRACLLGLRLHRPGLVLLRSRQAERGGQVLCNLMALCRTPCQERAIAAARRSRHALVSRRSMASVTGQVVHETRKERNPNYSAEGEEQEPGEDHLGADPLLARAIYVP